MTKKRFRCIIIFNDTLLWKAECSLFEFMKHKKYRTIALYALGVILIGLSFFLIITNFPAISDFFKSVLNVFAPFIYGAVIAYLTNPLMRLLEKKVFRFKKKTKWGEKLRRPLAVTLTFLIFGAVVTVIVWLIVPQVVKSVMDLDTQIETYVAAALKFVDNFIRDFPLFNGEYETLSEFLDVNELTTDIKALITSFSDYLETAANYILIYGSKFMIELKNALIGVIAAIYLLLGKERLIAKLKWGLAALFPRRHYLNMIYLMRYTDKTVGGFLIGKIIDSVIIGFLTFFVMYFAKMPFAPLISVIVGVTNIIPFFGPFIGAIPSAFIIFIAEPKMTLWFILMIFIIQQLDGNIIGPKILGSSTGLTSLAVLVSITIAGGFFGFAGMIFGVPAAAVICALTRQFLDKKLRKKNMPQNPEYYMTDPPPRDFSSQTIILDASEKVEGEDADPASIPDQISEWM